MPWENPDVNFEQVGGMDDLKEQISTKIVLPINHPELFEAYGKKAGGGILMYGPPGCGKTHLARATAGEVSASFLSVGIHDVLDMWIGESERKLHQLFEDARRRQPAVLFFDEVDALGGSRSDMRRFGRSRFDQPVPGRARRGAIGQRRPADPGRDQRSVASRFGVSSPGPFSTR